MAGTSDVSKLVWARRVIANAEWLNRVLIFGGVALVTVALLRLTGQNKFKIADVALPIDAVPAIVLAGTIAHRYCAGLFIHSVYEFKRRRPPGVQRELFDEITSTGGLAFRGLRERQRLGDRYYLMRADDPTTWVFVVGCGLILVGCWPVAGEHSSIQYYTRCLFALFLGCWNWLIGSKWTIWLSELKTPNADSALFRLYHLGRPLALGARPIASSPDLSGLELFLQGDKWFIGILGTVLLAAYVLWR